MINNSKDMKTDMKKIMTLLVFLLVAAPAMLRAADLQNTLVVLTKDQATHQFTLSKDKPSITFEGNNLKITCENTTATFALADIVRFTYKAVDPSGIDEQLSPETGINYEGGILVVSQLEAGKTVSVYTLDGRLVQQLKASHTGTFRLSFSTLPFGVYLVKANNITYKITKR